MKTIPVFCIFVSIEASFFPLYALYADSGRTGFAGLNDLTLSLNSQFGMLWGVGEEQVYENDDSEGLLSQLLWDIKPLWYAGMGLEFSQKDPMPEPGVFGALSVKFGIPAGSGVMEDRDWLAPGAELSNFSRHDNLTEGAMILDLAVGLSIPAWNIMTFRFSLGLSYTRFSWSARDGYYRYAEDAAGNPLPLTASVPAVSMSGTVLSYSQDWLALPLYLRVSLFPTRLFSGVIFCGAGPVLHFWGADNHYARINTVYYGQFIDEAGGGYLLEPGGEFRFSPLKTFSLSLRVSWRDISATPHTLSFGRHTGYGKRTWQFLGNTAGGRLRGMDLGIGLEVRL